MECWYGVLLFLALGPQHRHYQPVNGQFSQQECLDTSIALKMSLEHLEHINTSISDSELLSADALGDKHYFCCSFP